MGLNYLWLLCLVTLFVGFSLMALFLADAFSLCFRGGVAGLLSSLVALLAFG